jgi:glutathione peroxidase
MNTHAEESPFYTFQIPDIHGVTINFSDFKGHPVLIVNVASKCGFTKQYEGLERLHEQYKAKGLIILGVPSNDFKQEPGTDSQIDTFCSLTYGVQFLMTTRLHVKKSPKHPLYDFLSQTESVSWNFNKYLVSADGKKVTHFGSIVKPESRKLSRAIELALD